MAAWVHAPVPTYVHAVSNRSCNTMTRASIQPRRMGLRARKKKATHNARHQRCQCHTMLESAGARDSVSATYHGRARTASRGLTNVRLPRHIRCSVIEGTVSNVLQRLQTRGHQRLQGAR